MRNVEEQGNLFVALLYRKIWRDLWLWSYVKFSKFSIIKIVVGTETLKLGSFVPLNECISFCCEKVNQRFYIQLHYSEARSKKAAKLRQIIYSSEISTTDLSKRYH